MHHHQTTVIDVSSDDDNCLISSRSGFACKKEKIAPSLDVARRVSGKKKECALAAGASVSHSGKRRKVAGKKKEDEKIKVENRKKGLITVNKRIPQGTFLVLLPVMFGQEKRYKTHAYLAGKNVILYGLPGYHRDPNSYIDHSHWLATSKIWYAFYLDRVMKPATEFIEQVECLIGKCVDEVLFFTVNFNVVYGGLNYQTFREKFDVMKFVADLYSGLPKSYYSSLGLERDIQEDNMPPRTRRFMLLIDNLKVKYVNIESSDGQFIVPGADEISKVLSQQAIL